MAIRTDEIPRSGGIWKHYTNSVLKYREFDQYDCHSNPNSPTVKKTYTNYLVTVSVTVLRGDQ